MPVSVTAIEAAIQAWAVRATGYPDAAVIWDKQGGPRPVPPFVTLNHSGGQPDSSLPETVVADNPDATPGAEILISAVEHGELSVTVEVFTPAVLGDSSAVAVARAMRLRLNAGSEIDQFESSGLAFVDTTPVQNLTGLLETEFEGRARFDVRFRLADEFTETATYIETVEETGTVTE